LWPGLRVEQVPITHVTNGVHLPTWLGPSMRALLDRHLPSDWLSRAAEPDVWDGVEAIPAQELWAARSEQRATLVASVLDRSVADRLGRGDAVSYARAA